MNCSSIWHVSTHHAKDEGKELSIGNVNNAVEPPHGLSVSTVWHGTEGSTLQASWCSDGALAQQTQRPLAGMICVHAGDYVDALRLPDPTLLELTGDVRWWAVAWCSLLGYF